MISTAPDLPKGTGLSARFAPSLIGLVVFAIVTGLFFSGAHSTYNHLLTLWGFTPFRYPFVDIDGPLAAWECARKGVDVIISNPCDVLARPYNYSPFWMTIDWIPLSRIDRVWTGLALGTAFIVSLATLPPALSGAEIVVRVGAVLSTAVAFAIERANLDLLVFLLVISALPLLRRRAIAKALGYCVIFLAGAIKYYPFILLGLAVRERFRLTISIAVASLAALTAFYFFYAGQIHESLAYVSKGYPFGDMFGAQNLPMGIFMIFQSLPAPPIDAGRAVMVTMILLGGVVLWAMLKLKPTSDIPAALSRADESRRLALLAGALLLSGCFFTGQSITYRGIFLFFVIPGLSALAQDRDAGPIAFASRLAMIGIPFLMWAEALRLWIHLVITGTAPLDGFRTIHALQEPYDILAWLGRELCWWFLIGFLLTILVGDLVIRPLRKSFRPLLRYKG